LPAGLFCLITRQPSMLVASIVPLCRPFRLQFDIATDQSSETSPHGWSTGGTK
jgi:hypothetical protein